MGQIIFIMVLLAAFIMAVIVWAVKTVIEKILDLTSGINARSIAGEARAMSDLLDKSSRKIISGGKTINKGLGEVWKELGDL